jgi:hypothetical protein
LVALAVDSHAAPKKPPMPACVSTSMSTSGQCACCGLRSAWSAERSIAFGLDER